MKFSDPVNLVPSTHQLFLDSEFDLFLGFTSVIKAVPNSWIGEVGVGGMPRRKKVNESSTNLRSALSSTNKEKPQQRNAANARERARMRVLSRAFCRLKTTLPWVPADTKLSKLDTLRLASSYIAHLKGILEDDPYKPEEPLHPAMTLTWPFGFNRLGVGGSGGGGALLGSEEDDDPGVLDDGDSCGSSSSSWEEMTTTGLPVTPTTDCIHLDSSLKINKSTTLYDPPPLYQLPHLHVSNFHENIIYS